MNAPLHVKRHQSSWPRVRLGELAEHRLGKMLDKAKNKGVPRRYLRNPNVRWFDVDLTDLQEILVEEKDVHKYELRAGDVLICEGGEAGRAALWNGEQEGIIFQKACHRVRVGPKLDARFFIHRLMYDYFNGGLDDYYTGATIKHFTGQDLARYEIPLPPIDEQRRIAAILDKADALRRKRKRALELLGGLTRSFFLEMFGSPERNPKGWKAGRIGDLLEETQYGTSEKAGDRGNYPILRMGNITSDGRISFEGLKFLDLKGKDTGKFTLRKGDILFNRTNSADLVGKTAVFDRDEPFAFAGYLIRARAKAGVSPHYISGYLNSTHGKRTLRGMAKSIIGMANINAKEMQSIPILVPDFQTQHAYSEKLASIEALRLRCGVHLELLNSLFSSLQSRAFSGQL